MAKQFEPAVFAKVLVNYARWGTVLTAVDAILPPVISGEARAKYVDRLAPNDINNLPRLMEALVANLTHEQLIDKFRTALFEQSAADLVLREILRNQVTVDDDGFVAEAALQSLQRKVDSFRNAKSYFDVIEAARYRVCAIWVNAGQDPGIKGTGFLIAPDLVLTAYHVVSDLIAAVAIGAGEDGAVQVRDQAAAGSEQKLACLFDYWTVFSGNFDITKPPPGMVVVQAAANWLEWSSPKHPSDGVTHLFRPPPPADLTLDCALIRLSKRVGAGATSHGGGRMRGWLRLNGAAPRLQPGFAVGILQFASGGPQVFDDGEYRAQDASRSRIFYSTNSLGGSSGSPCFDAQPTLVAFHNAGRPKQYVGPTEQCNQGVLIDRVIPLLPPNVIAESQVGLSAENALWSVSDNPKQPQPILGRVDFKRTILSMCEPRISQRVMVVEEEAAVKDIGKSGKSFSTLILKAIARGRAGIVAEYSAPSLRGLAPEDFLRQLGQQIGLPSLDGMPEKPTDERQLARWWSNDLPKWFGQLIEERARKSGMSVREPVADLSTGAAAGLELAIREVIWIAIDDIHRSPLEGAMKELVAGMMGLTDTQHVLGPGLKALRWLIIGHRPDFVRERSIEYQFETISQKTIGTEAWTDCIKTAFISAGKAENFVETTAQAFYDYSRDVVPAINDPALTLQALSNAIVKAINRMLGTGA